MKELLFESITRTIRVKFLWCHSHCLQVTMEDHSPDQDEIKCVYIMIDKDEAAKLSEYIQEGLVYFGRQTQ